MHLHLRDKEMLKVVAPLTSESFAGALVMPNLVPPVDTMDDLLAYKERILTATKGDAFKPYMTLFFRDSYDYNLAPIVLDGSVYEILKRLQNPLLTNFMLKFQKTKA